MGNLRTAMAAWLFARSTGSKFLMRIEDLDSVTSSVESEGRQLADLEAIGINWDGEVTRQSERFDLYRDAIDRLEDAEAIYPCFCSRREIAEATRAPHSRHRPYPGTCSRLDSTSRAERALTRPAALRVRTTTSILKFSDELAGEQRLALDDFVVQRNDGTPAYNLAVTIDDCATGVEMVVRGDDLLDSTPRQIYLAKLLGFPHLRFAHIPLVVDELDQRLAKRSGAETLDERASLGESTEQTIQILLRSLAIDDAVTATEGVTKFRPSAISRRPWKLVPVANSLS